MKNKMFQDQCRVNQIYLDKDLVLNQKKIQTKIKILILKIKIKEIKTTGINLKIIKIDVKEIQIILIKVIIVHHL